MKIIKLTKTIALLFLVSIALFSCSSKDDGDPVDPPSIKVKSISLNKTAITKTVGETEQLTATIKPSDATNKNVTWKSSNNEVASVDAEGKLTAKKEGTVVISVSTKDGNKSDECTVKVITPYIRMETTKDKLYIGIDAAEADRPNCWIDLNNNSIRDKGEEIEFAQNKAYYKTSEIITIYGKVNVFSCTGGNLTKLDVSNNTKLERIWCGENKLTKLDVSKNTNLEYISCGYNQLTKLDISNNKKLVEFHCGNNQLTKLDLSKNTKLKEIWCHFNQLAKLDISNNKNLIIIKFFRNKLIHLDVSKNTNLEYISCGNNQLTKLDLSNNTKLVEFACNYNQLTKLDLSKNINLTDISCISNQLTKLDLSKNTELKRINCGYNQLNKLDVSENAKLEMLWCEESKLLKSLNLANGKNASVVKGILTTGCPNLSCIQIDKGFTPNKNWLKDLAAQWNNTGSPCK